MTPQKRHHFISFGLAGILLLAVTLLLFRNLNYFEILRLNQSYENVLNHAAEQLRASNAQNISMDRSASVKFNEALISFLQQDTADKILNNPNIVSGLLRVIYQGKTSDNHTVNYRWIYDLKGNYLGFDHDPGPLEANHNVSPETAEKIGRAYLASRLPQDAIIELSDRNSDDDGQGTRVHNLTFLHQLQDAAAIQNEYTLVVSGSVVTTFFAESDFSKEGKDQWRSYEDALIFSLIFSVIVVTIVVIFAVFFLFRRLRKDNIDFQTRVGLVVLIPFWVLIAYEAYPDWLAMILGGGIGGIVIAVIAILVAAINDSANRERMPERLAIMDVLRSGYLRFREMGQALLQSLYMAALTTFLIALIWWVAGEAKIGVFTLKADEIWIYKLNKGVSEKVLDNFLMAFFGGSLIFGFLVAVLKPRFKKGWLFFGVLVVLFEVSGLWMLNLLPFWWMFLLSLPVAVLWANWVLKKDLVTLISAHFLTLIILDLKQWALLNSWDMHYGVLIRLLILGLVFFGGILLLYSRRSIVDIDAYVPGYISRFRERERIQNELEIARNIQYEFLPENLPELPGLDIASICKPAMEVGGDYYDFIEHDKQHIGVVVGDVSGKGISAAFYMTMTKGIIKTLARNMLAPAKLLSELNEIFFENSPRNIFISVLYGLFDLENRQLHFARAGHNPLLVHLQSKDNTKLLTPPGLAIGMNNGPLFSDIIEEVKISFQPGDLFVFYTDGIPESVNSRGEEFGEERLSQLIRDNADLPAKVLLQKIHDTVFDFTGNAAQHDDFTMVILKVT